MRTLLRHAADAVVAVLIAPPCAACARVLDAPLDGPVCAPCWSAVRAVPPPRCRICGDPLPSWRVLSVTMEQCARCRRSPPAIDAGAAAGEYEGALREIVHAFKFDGRRSLARPLGALMRQAGAAIVEGADCAVPVPLHPWRRLRRGFNQASDLAHQLGLPVVHALRRVRHTASQSGLTAGARRRNVHRSFACSPRVRTFARSSLVVGRVVVLVDDVRTTGATLDACAQVLKQAGAREVRALTAARAAMRGAP